MSSYKTNTFVIHARNTGVRSQTLSADNRMHVGRGFDVLESYEGLSLMMFTVLDNGCSIQIVWRMLKTTTGPTHQQPR